MQNVRISYNPYYNTTERHTEGALTRNSKRPSAYQHPDQKEEDSLKFIKN
jgi:hypothetical protein